MADRDKPRVLVICGATATGKTGLGVKIAKKLNTQIISADSMQIYKKLDIGTAKPTTEEMCGITHHMIDFLSPEESFSVADYVKSADELISNLNNQKLVPIIVGGTGQYISSTVNGLSFTREKKDDNLRQMLAQEAELIGNDAMHKKLEGIDPEYAALVHKNNAHRVQRAIELFILTGKTMSAQIKDSLPPEMPYQSTIINIGFRNRELLYERINARVDSMMQKNLIAEAEYVYNNRTLFVTAAQAIGYKEFFAYFENKCSLDECVDTLKQASRNYAKRQLTWFNKIPQSHYLYIDEQDCEKEILNIWENINNERTPKA